MKKVSALLLSLLLVLTLAGCGKKETNTSEAGGVSGKIVVWEHTTSFEEPLAAVVEAFNKEYPDVEVEMEVKSSDYYSVLTTALQSGSGPDLFWTNGTSTDNMKTFVDQGVILDISNDVKMDNLSEDSFDLTIIDGKTYSVPWMAFDARAVYYNKDIFTELGLELPKTFSEFETMLETIKKGGYIPLSFGALDSWSLLWIYESLLGAMYPEYCEGFSDYSIDIAGEPARETLNKIKEWADKGYFGEGFVGVDSDGQILAFTTGKAAMTIQGSWTTSTYEENNPDLNFGAFQIPSEDGVKSMIGSFANGFSINAETENKEAALAFANFCATKEAQQIWISKQNGVSGAEDIPSAKGVAEEISVADQTFGTWQSLLTRYSTGDISAASIWEEDSPGVFTDTISVDKLMDNIGKAMD